MVNNGRRFDEIDGICIRKAESTVARSSFGIDRFCRFGCAMKDGKRHFDRTRGSKDDEAWIAPTRLCEVSEAIGIYRPRIDGCQAVETEDTVDEW